MKTAAAFCFAAASIMVDRIDLARAAGGLDPVGKVHVPIGMADAVDSLKTFVEAEGCFSPGFATYGVYLWVYDRQAERLVAPTMSDVNTLALAVDISSTSMASRWLRPSKVAVVDRAAGPRAPTSPKISSTISRAAR